MNYTFTTIDANVEELTINTGLVSKVARDGLLTFRFRLEHTSCGWLATVPRDAQPIKLNYSGVTDYNTLVNSIFEQIDHLTCRAYLSCNFHVNSGGFFKLVASWQGWSIVASSDPRLDREEWSIMFSKPGRPILRGTYKDLDFGLKSLREYIEIAFEYVEVSPC